MKTTRNLILSLALVLSAGLISCAHSFSLPFGEPEREGNDAALALALLYLLGSSENGGASANECSNASGMVICLPAGLAR